MKRICIFDWAGTIVDKGSYAPLHAFKKTLKSFNITKTDDEINKYMGMDKFTHMHSLTKDINLTRKIYPILIENIKESIYEYSEPVPCVNELFKYLKRKNYVIGSTSGYNRELLNVAIFTAFKQGMHIPYNVSSDEVSYARPHADMIFKNMYHFGIVNKPTFLVKVGDTIADIEEGRSADATINIGISNNKDLTTKMYRSGATHVIKDLEEVFRIL